MRNEQVTRVVTYTVATSVGLVGVGLVVSVLVGESIVRHINRWMGPG